MSTTTQRSLDKVKVTDKGKSVEVSYTEKIIHTLPPGVDPESQPEPPPPAILHHKLEGNAGPHPDLIRAIRKLRKAALQICGIEDFSNIDDYNVTGLSLSGQDDETQAIITVSKTVEWSGKAYTFNTPATSLADNEKFGDSAKLDKICRDVELEALAYAVDGKHADPEQMEIAFPKVEA